MNPENLYYVYQLGLTNGDVQHRCLGKFYLQGTNFVLLEDHGLPFDLSENSTPNDIAQSIHRLSVSPYSRVVCQADIQAGKHPELHNTELPEKGSKQTHSTFEYHRVGQPVPQELIADPNGGVFLDGFQLAPEEIEHVKQTILSNKATLRKPVPMIKSEDGQGFESQDSALPEFGNKLAHNQFLKTAPKMVHVFIDGHATDSMAGEYGFKTADKAIKALGRSVSEAAGESVGKHAKLFRIGGDKFAVAVPTAEHAIGMIRNLRAKLEKIPSVNGTHALAATIGVGDTHENALAAHQQAKASRPPGLVPGQAGTHVVLNVPGY
jgi:GGDEF domain-containing protein